MAHNVESMFSVREVPWHGLGQIVSEAPSSAEAIKLAGLDWKVLEQSVHNYSEGSDTFSEIDGYKALVRSDNRRVLSIMGENYTPLQNSEAFSFFDPFVDAGLASFQTAGSLRQGGVVWILAELNKAPIEVGNGDPVSKYLLLSNSHDGTMAVRVGFTPVRVVCNNTLTMAHDSNISKLIRIRHSRKVKENVEALQDVVNAMDASFEATAEQYKHLSKIAINSKDLEKYISIIFKTRPNGNEREKLRDKKMQEIITNLFENGAGQHLKSARGTAWGAYNAVTEYLTHEKGPNSEARLNSNWFSYNKKINDDAFNEALVMVK